jgi:hypothetical protein
MANESRIAEIESKYLKATPGSEEYKTYWGDPKQTVQKEYLALLDEKAKAADAKEPWRQPSNPTGPSWQE